MDFVEKWKMKLFGRGVETFKIDEMAADGEVLTLRHVGKTKRRANSIIETWDNKGDEIVAAPIHFISSDHVSQPAFVATGGVTVKLYARPSIYPNREEVIGKAATFDDITEAMDLNKSVKNIIIGILIGMVLYAVVVGPMLGAIFR